MSLNSLRVNALVLALPATRQANAGNYVEICKAPLGSTPLLGWSICAATTSSVVDNVTVVGDSRELAPLAEQYGANFHFCDPKRLDPLAPARSAFRDARKAVFSQEQGDHILVSLNYAFPFRTPDLIDSVCKACLTEQQKTVAAVTCMYTNSFWLTKKRKKWYPVDDPQSGYAIVAGLATAHPFFSRNIEVSASNLSYARHLFRHLEKAEKDLSDSEASELIEHIRSAEAPPEIQIPQRNFIANQVVVPITGLPTVRVLGTHHLDQARHMVNEEIVWWTPDGETAKTLQKSRSLPGDQYQVQSTGTHQRDESTEVTLHTIPTPGELREIIDRTTPYKGQEVYLRRKHETIWKCLSDTELSKPTLLVKSHDLSQPQSPEIFNEFARGSFTLTRDNTVMSHDEAISLTILEKKLTLTLKDSVKSGDRLIVSAFNRDLIHINTGFHQFCRGKWRKGAYMSRLPFPQKLSLIGEGDTLSTRLPNETFFGTVVWMRSGADLKNSRVCIEPRTVEGVIAYSKDSGEPINLLSDKPISDSSDIPEVYEWWGEVYLPAVVTDSDTGWEICGT